MEQEQKSPRRPGWPGKRRMPGCSGWSILVWLLILALVVPSAWNALGTTLADVHEIHYSAFRQQVRENNVEQVTVSKTEIKGQLKEPAEIEDEQGETTEYTKFVRVWLK